MIDVILFFILLLGLAPLIGNYMAKVFKGEYKALNRVEDFIYRICGIEQSEMSWKEYLKALLFFNLLGFLLLFFIQILQQNLPWNPENLPGVPLALAFNTSASFVTNTNWQSYGGENTLSYFTQMAGLTVQNFLSAATGITALLVLIRGIINKGSEKLGNFWIDLVRTVIYILLPLSIILACFLASQGVIQNLKPYAHITTVEGGSQIIPMGPTASQVAIKQLGTNGGGFFSTNSAHPFENPTALSNFLENFAIIIIPAALVFMFGRLTSNIKHAYVIFGVMAFLLLGGFLISNWSEGVNNEFLGFSPVMEGKEARFTNTEDILWSTTTTAVANGSVNCMHSSLSPLAGGVAMLNMMVGEVVFGGAGVGLLGMLMFIILTVFICGLMVGRSPEYMGKKIEKSEIQWAMFAILVPCTLILLGSGFSAIFKKALEGLSASGPHGLSELLYNFSSTAGNNGSAFAGLKANTNYYNIFFGVIMILSRLAILIPSFVIAGNLSEKKVFASSVGSFSTESLLFGGLLVGIIMLIAALTFFPALSLGPILEHLLMIRGGV